MSMDDKEKEELKKILQESFKDVLINELTDKVYNRNFRKFREVDGVAQIVTDNNNGFIVSLSLNVPTTPTQLSTDTQLVKRMTITAPSSNTDSVFIGNRDYQSYSLPAGQSLILEDVIPANIYIYSTSSGQVLNIIYSGIDLW
jgi:hypothetical protein